MVDIKEIQNAIEIFKSIANCNEIMDGNGYKNNEPIPLAIKALQEKLARENPKPLTLEELKQMEGEPVWVETMKQWRIVNINCQNNLIVLYSVFNTISAKHVFNNDGRIYRNKPKEE